MPASTFARLVKTCVDRGRFTVLELCDPDLADCSERHFYNWLNGQDSTGREVHLPDYKTERLAKYLCRHGELVPISAFYSLDHVLICRARGQANGTVRDEIIRALKDLAGLDDTHAERSRAKMRVLLDDLRQVIADLEAEYELLPE